MNKYKKAFNTICDILGYYMVHMDESLLPSDNEIHDAMATLRWLTEKAASFEWIPVSEKLPDEHDSIFARLYGTDKWDDALWRTKSKEVLVTIEYEDGVRTVKSSHTTDGKWVVEKRAELSKCNVVAWKPFPEPYKEKENDLSRNH